MNKSINIYLIPGQGADKRLFQELKFNFIFKVHHIHFSTPEKGMTMHAYAKVLAEQIDTSKPFIVIGTSLGGMLATEMGDFLNPLSIIIISSAKKRSEIPFSYRFQKQIPFYKIIPPALVKIGAKIMQPIVEPDRNKRKGVFKAMLNDKDPLFLSRTIEMIVKWERDSYSDKIIHIHGDKDRTLPIKNVRFTYLVRNGSHMMTLTKAKKVSKLIYKCYFHNH